MAWFRKERKPKAVRRGRQGSPIPEGLWTKCEGCKEAIFSRELEKNLQVCPKCGYHFRISARERLEQLLDDGYFAEFDQDIAPVDALGFEDTKPYRKRIVENQKKTGLRDALIACTGALGGYPVVVAVMEYGFMGGSMGSVVGEKVTRAAEKALRERCPLFVISCSGGARMQEGALSLMQMAKISAALARMSDAGLPYISILTDPTTGGVTASFAMLGDLNVAEPKALIGFAGPRVIEQTIRQKLPVGFQRSEFLLEHGMIDLIVERSQMRDVLISCLQFMIGSTQPTDADYSAVTSS